MQILLNNFIIDLDDGSESALLFVNDSKMGAERVILYTGLYTGIAFKGTSANLTIRYLVEFVKNRHTWAVITPLAGE